MSLYTLIILSTISGPLLLSFDKKVHFYTYWKAFIPAIILVGLIFLAWDEFFTIKEIWGFNPNYIERIYIGHLPIEEICFFIVVPYACVFIYEVLNSYFPNFSTKKIGHYFAFVFTFSGLTFAIVNMENWYTSSACIISALLTIGIYFVNRAKWYGNFVFAYVVCLIPFLIVNGILTGAVTDQPIVWYSEEHIMGPRIITIPLEDLYYNYSMLLPIFGLYEYFKGKMKMN